MERYHANRTFGLHPLALFNLVHDVVSDVDIRDPLLGLDVREQYLTKFLNSSSRAKAEQEQPTQGHIGDL